MVKNTEALSVSICSGIFINIIVQLKKIAGHVYFFQGKKCQPIHANYRYKRREKFKKSLCDRITVSMK